MPAEYLNAVLRRLPPEHSERLTRRGARVDMIFGEHVYHAGDVVERVDFPETAMLSSITSTKDGRSAESGMTGREGAHGLTEACGSGRIGFDSLVQLAGTAWRIPADACREMAEESSAFRRAMWRQAEFQMTEARQSSTCRSFHTVEARLARWLLEIRDRAGGTATSVALTQEFMAAMLGVKRTTVTAMAQELQKSGVIRYSRGRVDLLDIAGLEVLTCECRAVVEKARQTAMSDGRD